MKRLFFTSDQHYGHDNIIKYSGRPFRDASHMTEELITRHNNVVGPTDRVFHLGDFSLRSHLVTQILPKLNGTHHLVMGNHDACHPCHGPTGRNRELARYYAAGFVSISERSEIYVEGLGSVMLCHMPERKADTAYDERFLGYRPTEDELEGFDWLLHGHVHERWRLNGRMINVGVDQWDYAPVEGSELARFVRRNSSRCAS